MLTAGEDTQTSQGSLQIALFSCPPLALPQSLKGELKPPPLLFHPAGGAARTAGASMCADPVTYSCSSS